MSPLPHPSKKYLPNYLKRFFGRRALLTLGSVFFYCLSGASARAEWVEIASNATVNRTLYIDPASKKKSRKFITIWAMYDDAKPLLINNKPSLSSIHEYQVDCNNQTQQSLRRTFYEGPKGTGPQVGSSIEPDWVPIDPGTVAQALYKVTLSQALIQAACAKD